MAKRTSAKLPETSLPTEVPQPTLPPLLQLVHSSTSLVHKHTAKLKHKAKLLTRKAKPAPSTRAEWYECPDPTLPSVSSF